MGNEGSREAAAVGEEGGRRRSREALAARRRIEVFYADREAAARARGSARDVLARRGLAGRERAAVLRRLAVREMEDARARRRSFRLADFVFERKIGEGTYGEVFLVRLRESGELFALKKIDKRAVLRRRFVANVWLERFVLASCGNEPFVCRLFASFQDVSHLYFLCEYLPGGDLLSMLQREDRLRPDVARFYIAEIILALDALHRCGVIHRDVKPDNIIFGAHGHVRLADFGLSKSLLHVPPALPPLRTPSPVSAAAAASLSSSSFAFDSEECDAYEDGSSYWDHPPTYPERLPTGLTPQYIDHVRSGAGNPDHIPVNQRSLGWSAVARLVSLTTVGTPNYIAPEVILEGAAYNETADWWSVGIILYEMLVGWPPFQDPSTTVTFAMISNSARFLTFVDTYTGERLVSPVAESVIRQMLHPDPARRLGAQRGLDEFKEHPFFAGIPWDTIHQLRPPFVPELDSDTDTRYFDDYDLTTTTASHEDDPPPPPPPQQQPHARAASHTRVGSVSHAAQQQQPSRRERAGSLSFAARPAARGAPLPPVPEAHSTGNSGSSSAGVVVLGGDAAHVPGAFHEDDVSFPSSAASHGTGGFGGAAAPRADQSPAARAQAKAQAQAQLQAVDYRPASAAHGATGASASVSQSTLGRGSAGSSRDGGAGGRNFEHRASGASGASAGNAGIDSSSLRGYLREYEERCIHPEFVGFTFISRAPPSRQGIPEDLFEPPAPEPAPSAIAAATAVLSPFESAGDVNDLQGLSRRGSLRQRVDGVVFAGGGGRRPGDHVGVGRANGPDSRRPRFVDDGRDDEDDLSSEDGLGDVSDDDASEDDEDDDSRSAASPEDEDDFAGDPDFQLSRLLEEQVLDDQEYGDADDWREPSKLGSQSGLNVDSRVSFRENGVNAGRRPERDKEPAMSVSPNSSSAGRSRDVARGAHPSSSQGPSAASSMRSEPVEDARKPELDHYTASRGSRGVPRVDSRRSEASELSPEGERPALSERPPLVTQAPVPVRVEIQPAPLEPVVRSPPRSGSPRRRTSSPILRQPSPVTPRPAAEPFVPSRSPIPRNGDVRRSVVIPPTVDLGADDASNALSHSRTASGRFVLRQTHSRRTDANQRSIFSVSSQTAPGPLQEDAEFLDAELRNAASASGALPALEVAAVLAAVDGSAESRPSSATLRSQPWDPRSSPEHPRQASVIPNAAVLSAALGATQGSGGQPGDSIEFPVDVPSLTSAQSATSGGAAVRSEDCAHQQEPLPSLSDADDGTWPYGDSGTAASFVVPDSNAAGKASTADSDMARILGSRSGHHGSSSLGDSSSVLRQVEEVKLAMDASVDSVGQSNDGAAENLPASSSVLVPGATGPVRSPSSIAAGAQGVETEGTSSDADQETNVQDYDLRSAGSDIRRGRSRTRKEDEP